MGLRTNHHGVLTDGVAPSKRGTSSEGSIDEKKMTRSVTLYTSDSYQDPYNTSFTNRFDIPLNAEGRAILHEAVKRDHGPC